MVRSYTLLVVVIAAIVGILSLRSAQCALAKGGCGMPFLASYYGDSFDVRQTKTATVASSDSTFSSFPELDPVQVFKEWRTHHSAQALRGSIVLKDRKFIVAKFSCPQQVGVQAADYAAALLLAIATNRTLLYTYDGIRKWIEGGQNAPEVCDHILRRAEWIPLYVDHRSQLPGVQRVNASFSGIEELQSRIDKGLSLHEDISDKALVEIPRLWELGARPGYWRGLMDLRDVYASSYISDMFGLDPPLHLRSSTHKLYKEGIHYLFGMLFWESFALTEELVESVRNDVVVPNASFFSVGVHSRHPSNRDDGTDVSDEIACINKLVRTLGNGRPCLAYLMSDRQETVRRISKHVQIAHNCTVVLASQRESANGTEHVDEHGAFAGAGYFQDLVVVGQADSAFISKRRSSTSLVAEFMEYRRRQKMWKSDGTRESSRMGECH